MTTRESVLSELISLTTLVILLRPGEAVNNCSINISVFLKAADIYQDAVFQSAQQTYLNSLQGPNSRNTSVVRIHLTKIDTGNVSLGIDGLSSAIQWIGNISPSLHGAIFLDIMKDDKFNAALLENCRIPSIGLIQSHSGVPATQESTSTFTRVATLSVIEYAQAMVKIMQKMGWRSLCLVVTADHEGKVFADTVRWFAFKEKWRLLETVWIHEDQRETINTTGIEKLLNATADVILGHIRARSADEIFWGIQKLLTKDNSSAWLVTDVTTYGVQNVYSLPAGLMKVSLKSPDLDHSVNYYTNVLRDALALFGNAFQTAFNEEPGEECSALEKSERVQKRAIRYLRQTHMEGLTSLFSKRSVFDKAQAVFNVWNLRKDLDGRKHWSLIGLGTHSSIALETVLVPNGDIITPLLHQMRPVLRVPVIVWPPLVQAKDPINDSNFNRSCVGKAIPCYKKLHATNSTRQVKRKFCCFGASIDFLEFLRRDLGFDVEVYLAPDDQYGTQRATIGKWDGVVNELVSGNGDLAVDLSLSMYRATMVDLVYPNIPLALNILVAKEHSYTEQASSWFSWLAPFEYGVWVAILVTCNVVLLVVWWLDRKSPKGYYHILKDSDEDAFTLLDSMSYVWGVAFGKDIGAEKTPRSNSARMVSAVYAFLALVMVNTYCANLMAFLLQENVDLPITGIMDAKLTEKSLSPPDGFKLGITRGSNEEEYFRNHVDDVFRKIYHVNLKIHLFDTFQQGITEFKNKKVDGFVADYKSLLQAGYDDQSCKYSLAGPNFFNFGYAFAFPKGSPWTEEANLSVLKNLENNSIQAIIDYWFDKQSCDTVPPRQLGFEKFFGLFLLLASVVGFCFMALVSEMLIIFILIKFSKHLGPIGRSLKRMIFSVRKGEENDVHIAWVQLCRRRKTLRPGITVSPVSPAAMRRASFFNLNFDEFVEVPRLEHNIYLPDLNNGVTGGPRGNGNLAEPNEPDSSCRAADL